MPASFACDGLPIANGAPRHSAASRPLRSITPSDHEKHLGFRSFYDVLIDRTGHEKTGRLRSARTSRRHGTARFLSTHAEKTITPSLQPLPSARTRKSFSLHLQTHTASGV